MVVYDITNPDSFKAIATWMAEIEKYGAPGMCKLLIGNKCDLTDDRAIKQQEGAAIAKHYGMKFLETSAKDSISVLDAFKLMSKEIYNKSTKKAMPNIRTHEKPNVIRGETITLENPTEGKVKSG